MQFTGCSECFHVLLCSLQGVFMCCYAVYRVFSCVAMQFTGCFHVLLCSLQGVFMCCYEVAGVL